MTGVNKDFKKWARSLSGCDNSNLAAEIWVSGIEFGLSQEKDITSYYSGLNNEMKDINYKPNFKNFIWDDDGLTYTYGRNLAKLLCAYKGKNVSSYNDIETYCSGSNIFKMNLYPIAFRGTSPELWVNHNLEKITGFETKHQYMTWCNLNRFPYYADLVYKHKPKLIIGTGITYLSEFFTCFTKHSEKKIHSVKTGVLEDKSKSSNNNYIRRYYWGKINEQTTLVVIPFFSGRYGLNSDVLRQEMGDKLRSLNK